MSRHLPSRIGRYEIANLLGQGSLGPVYLALDPLLGRHVAIKVLTIDDVDLARRGASAARAAAALTHPNIVTVYEVGEHDGSPFIAMEYIDGESLAQIITRRDLSMERRLELIQALCEALAYAHDRGILHTNIQPGEIFVTRDGIVKVPLLGLARLRLGSSTNSGVIVATPQYFSPEQVRCVAVDGRSDVFSVGVILFELLTSTRPYSGDLPTLLREILTSAPTPASDLNAQIGPALEAVIDKALQKDPSHRYRTMRDFARALARVRLELETDASVSLTPPPSPAARPSASIEMHRVDTSRLRADRIELAIREARSLEAAGRYEEAIHACESALILDPTDARALELLERSETTMAERNAGSAAPSADAVATPRRIDENVQFSVYRPPAIEPAKWYSMLVFAHLSSRRPDAAPDEPDPLEEVDRRAKALLGNRASAPTSRVDALAAIPEEGHLRVVPHVHGIEFNPPEHTFVWVHSIHQVEFSLRADVAMTGRTARGALDVYLGALAVAHIPLAIPVEPRVDPRERRVGQTANPYRKLFASYSHRDAVVVRQFENYAKGLGDRYLRDILDLRAGEVWNSRLCELIDAADVFQLFWSRNSMDSVFVRQEWEHALTVAKPDFIRPVYWEVPFPKREGLPPIDLSRLHFAFVGTSAPPDVAPGEPPEDAMMKREVAREREENARRMEDARARAEILQREAALRAEAAEGSRLRLESNVRAQMESERRARAEAEQRELAEHRRSREDTQITARKTSQDAEFELTPPASPSPAAAVAPPYASVPSAAPPSVRASTATSRGLWFVVVALVLLTGAFLRWC